MKGPNLHTAALMAGWPSPATRDHHAQGATHNDKARSSSLATVVEKKLLLGRQALGTEPSGSPAPTGKRAALNTDFTRWLMGFPPAWDASAPTATR